MSRRAPLVTADVVVVDGAALNFLSVGDWGRNGRENQDLVAAAMGAWAERVGAAFVVSVGDNFYDAGVASPAAVVRFTDVYA